MRSFQYGGIILLCCFSMVFSQTVAQTIEISVSNIRNTKGQIRLAFYNTAESFDKDKPPLFYKIVSKSAVKDGTLQVSYTNLARGTYGIVLLDDENSNQDMDYRFFMPVEGFGFSDYYHTGMTRPKFEKFKFDLGAGTRKIQIKIRYL